MAHQRRWDSAERRDKVVFVCGLPSSCNRLVRDYVEHLGAAAMVTHSPPNKRVLEDAGVTHIQTGGISVLAQLVYVPIVRKRERYVIVPERDPDVWKSAMRKNFLKRGATSIDDDELETMRKLYVDNRESELEFLRAPRLNLPVRKIAEDPERAGRIIAAFLSLPFKPWHTDIYDPDERHLCQA